MPHAVADLHELLHRLGIRMPVILVARSYGSLISRLYTSLHPADVAGLVLVDGTHERQVRAFGTIETVARHSARGGHEHAVGRVGAVRQRNGARPRSVAITP